MAFLIDKTFVVRAPAPAVWEFLTDPRRVARCMPGAAITEQRDDGTWAGTLTVKVGPVTASYKGQLSFARLDAAARAAEIVASGQDVKGKGGARMKLTSRLAEPGPGETEVFASSELEVTGILAQMGRGMVQDVGDQIFKKFTDAMRAELEAPIDRASSSAAPPPATAGGGREGGAQPPVDVLSMGAGVAARAAGRSLRRPAVWIALAIFILVAFWLMGRVRP